MSSLQLLYCTVTSTTRKKVTVQKIRPPFTPYIPTSTYNYYPKAAMTTFCLDIHNDPNNFPE